MNLVNNITPEKAIELAGEWFHDGGWITLPPKKELESKAFQIWTNWPKIMNQKLVWEMLFNPLGEPYILEGNLEQYHKAQKLKLFDNWERVKSANHSHHYSNGIVNIIFNVETDGPIKLFCNNKNKGIITTPQHLLNEVEKYNDGIEKPTKELCEITNNADHNWDYLDNDKTRYYDKTAFDKTMKHYTSKLIQIPWSKSLIKQLTA